MNCLNWIDVTNLLKPANNNRIFILITHQLVLLTRIVMRNSRIKLFNSTMFEQQMSEIMNLSVISY